jgi:hypothetical protein
MSPNEMVNLDEFERLLLTHWTCFINPNRLIAFVLANVRDTELTLQKSTNPSTKSLKITISQFRASEDRTFILWVEFIIPKSTGFAVGTCELRFDPLTGTIEHLQTIGNLISLNNTNEGII